MTVDDLTRSASSRADRPAQSARDFWLTAELRPVGDLGAAEIARLGQDLTSLADRANIVVLNLVAATVADPEAFAEALRSPGAKLSGPDRCLLLVGADAALLGALRRRGGDIATLTATAAT
jgi:hypothetical protein